MMCEYFKFNILSYIESTSHRCCPLTFTCVFTCVFYLCFLRVFDTCFLRVLLRVLITCVFTCVFMCFLRVFERVFLSCVDVLPVCLNTSITMVDW